MIRELPVRATLTQVEVAQPLGHNPDGFEPQIPHDFRVTAPDFPQFLPGNPSPFFFLRPLKTLIKL